MWIFVVCEDNGWGEVFQSIFGQGLYTWQNKIMVFHPQICLSETLLSLRRTGTALEMDGAGRGLGLCGLQHPLMVPALAPCTSLNPYKSFQTMS